MERTPFKSPLPCYGMEQDLKTEKCRTCPHREGCRQHMGDRRDKVKLSQAVFDTVPKALSIVVLEGEDPELVNIQTVYTECHLSVFGQKPKDDVRRYAPELARICARMECSIRLYMLAAMMGFKLNRDYVVGHTDGKPGSFSARHLTTTNAGKHVQMYAGICRKEFGTFSLHGLVNADRTGVGPTLIEKQLLASEVIAGKFIVAHKALHGGPSEPLLYHWHETSLDPYWLAIQPSYMQLVLDPHIHGRQGSPAQKRHRYAVVQTLRHLKTHVHVARAVHQARNAILPQAVGLVVNHHHFDVDDFEIGSAPIKDSFTLWKNIGRAIQHYRCLNLYYGGSP